ncbi:aminoglycoside phosphotransferase family protein [Parvibaculum sp.]|uniref:phosphotransferase family protein n=1 Tax=Parvibaculum sp. TaxID=2024848 RepID=UPI000C92CDF6|nr:aminoglycoside phosphotransferase family protein [Parvibaculum sp.]MAB14515.1 hypothetical protein [Parvibaculum sp.]
MDIDSRLTGLPDIPDLPPGEARLLAEGLWSSVYRLGDGSLLKLVRRTGGGLGSGEAIFRREAIAYEALSDLQGTHFSLPRLLGHGDLESGGSLHAGWLRISAHEGAPLAAERLVFAPVQTRDAIGERIGAAIAEFHEMTTRLAREADLRLGDTVARSIGLAAHRMGQPDERLMAERLADAWAAEIETGPLVFVHGDLNLSNILGETGTHKTFGTGRARPGALGLVDLAESGWSLPETDFRHLENFGPMGEAVLRGYEARADRDVSMKRIRMAMAANALCTLAIEGHSGHPREGMRRRAALVHAMEAAGIA